MYNYPVWFDGDSAFYYLSKKVPPKGESLIYFLEGKDTPVSISTPVDIMKATLGRQMCDSILDLAGRKLRTHHRRGAAGIRRACTCGCTEAIEAVFKAGEENDRREYVEGAVEDMLYFVRRHIERIDEYRAFADDMIKFLRATGSSSAGLKPFLDSLEQTAQQIPQEYEVQKENIKSLNYAGELARKTTDLTRRKSPQNLPTCLELCKEWREMGGAQDGLLAQYHIIARKLFQEAGFGCATQPKAVELAQEIRRRCRQCLRNPDGYEIWPNY
jgi:Rad3-related DNA helicase